MARVSPNNRACAIALGMLASACTVGPDYRPPANAALKVPDRYKGVAETAAKPAETAVVTPVVDADLATWWTSFQDPTLTNLIERAQAASISVEIAGARLSQARASLRGTRSALFPAIDANTSITRSIGRDQNNFVDPVSGVIRSTGGDTTNYRAGIGASYEVDLFGRVGRSIEAARATLVGAEYDLHFAQLSVAADVGNAYLDARLAQLRLDVARKNLASQDEAVTIVGYRVQAGLVSSLDGEQARALRAQTASTIPTIEANYANAINRIAVLLGEAPGAVDPLLVAPAPIPLPPATLGVGLPVELLRRRPDVVGAERDLAAQTAQIGVATAALYPALRLSGSFNGSGLQIDEVLRDALGQVGAAISAPIFQGGRLRAAIDSQRSAAAIALADYRQTVLTALEEVENALNGLNTAERRERELLLSTQASETAAIYARSQYRAGLIDFQALLESERSLLNAEDQRATARADRASATVLLYRALGGGWQSAPVPGSATANLIAPSSPARP